MQDGLSSGLFSGVRWHGGSRDTTYPGQNAPVKGGNYSMPNKKTVVPYAGDAAGTGDFRISA